MDIQSSPENADVASWVWDIPQDAVQWFGNPEGLLGLQAGSYSGRFSQYLTALHPDDAPAAKQTLIDCLRGRRPTYRTQERVVRPDGEVRWVEAIGQGEYAADGRAVRLAGVVRDVTEQRNAAGRIRELEDFSATLSHDLLAPAHTIRAIAQMLREDCAPSLSDRGRDLLGRIERSALRMNEMVRALLELTRLGRVSLDLAPVNLAELVVEVVEDVRVGCGFHGQIDVAPLPRCVGDARLLRQALQNLIANAMKFSRYSTRPRIEVRAVRLANGGAEYCVRDNGCGFDMRQADRLFAAFQRLHSQREYEGSGIGLATVRRIVEHHGGTVRAHSEPGRGAAFYFTLPTC